VPVLVGIDFGSKRVGVAVSDERGAVAFPRTTIANDRLLIPTLIDLIRRENATTVVIGDSKNLKGGDNAVTPQMKEFGLNLQKSLSVSVHYEPEFYTSFEARRDTGKSTVDAEAATIILNSYIARTSS
jgi:putative Holliday junction resolvase